MRVRCDNCSAPIPAGDVDLATRLAKCRACDAVFDFTPQIGGTPTSIVLRKPRVPLPETLRVVEDIGDDLLGASYRTPAASDGRLVITRSWYTA